MTQLLGWKRLARGIEPAFVSCLLFLSVPQSVLAKSLNLSSTAQSQISPVAGTIKIGSVLHSIRSGDLLTPAELVALNQVVSTGHQTLTLSGAGSAVGGKLVLNVKTGSIDQLTIPSHVSVFADVSKGSTLSILGTLNNFGTIFAFSRLQSVEAATISANRIINGTTGQILAMVPKIFVPNAVNQLDLNLISNQSIQNSGMIAGYQNIFLSSASGQINNSGVITTRHGSINFSGPSDKVLQINNVGGLIQATNGSINIRGETGVALNGGNLFSQVLNLSSSCGPVNSMVQTVTGLINIKASESHFLATATPLLRFGNTDISGDPTFYNANGSISMGNLSISDGASLAIAASQDVTVGDITMTNDNSGGKGGDILIVSGVNFVNAPPGGGATPSALPITIGSSAGLGPGSASGGAIRTGEIRSNGGNIQLISFAKPGNVTDPALSGTISAPLVDAGGGAITMMAEAMNTPIGCTYTLGDVKTVNTNGGVGTISIFGTSPVIQGGTTAGQMTINHDGTIASGAFAPGNFRMAYIHAYSNGSGSWKFTADKDITIDAAIDDGGRHIELSSLHGNVTVPSISGKSITVDAAGTFTQSNLGGKVQGTIQSSSLIKILANDITIGGTITSNLSNGIGRIDLQADGIIQNNGFIVAFNNAAGNSIFFSSRTPGAGDVTVKNSGRIYAYNDSDPSSGIVAFDSGPDGAVSVSGALFSPAIRAGNYIGVGDVDPITLAVKHPVVASAQQPFQFGNYSVNSDYVGTLVYSDPTAVNTNTSSITQTSETGMHITASADGTRFANSVSNMTDSVSKLTISVSDFAALSGSTIIDTDETPVNRINCKRSMIEIASNSNVEPYSEGGIQVIFPAGGKFEIGNGFTLVAPTARTAIKTKMGDVIVKEGAIALFEVDGDELTVYDMHDQHSSDITFEHGDQKIEIATGQELSVSLGIHHHSSSIALRNEHSYHSSKLVCSVGDFSVHSALANGVYHKLNTMGAASAAKTLSKLLKSAASVQIATGGRGPYKR